MNYSASRMMVVWPSRFPTVESTRGCVMSPAALAERVYTGRMGNTQPGDGGKYRGRGLIQLTGKDWYARYAKASGVDVLTNPDLLLEPQYATDSAAWEWEFDGCNAIADKQDWVGLIKKINGGMTGHAERVALIQRALKTFI